MQIAIKKLGETEYKVSYDLGDGVNHPAGHCSSEMEARAVAYGIQRGVEAVKKLIGIGAHFDGNIQVAA